MFKTSISNFYFEDLTSNYLFFIFDLHKKINFINKYGLPNI
jgi:hypothetical protein